MRLVLFIWIAATLSTKVDLGKQRSSDPNRASLRISVTDGDTGAELPCRITIVNDRDELASINVKPESGLAVRPGVVYSRDGRAEVRVSPGAYTIYAGRGFEYSLDTRRVSVTAGESLAVAMQIRREVPTPGLVSCDTHVHTLTYSGHGDATLEERVITIAGEGIEMPVATEHNRHADYSEAALKQKVSAFFTPVIGNEVTTRKGHFNAFPIRADSPIPDSSLVDWPNLMASIRSIAGEGFIVLNHPRDLHSNFRPFDSANFNPATGKSRHGFEFGFDALEVMNSGALQSDLMQAYRDWFAILNSGRRVTSVGSSDCHDVNRHIVGQSRTYIASRDEDPGRIDIQEACRNLRAGRALVSMGLLTELTVNERFRPGDLATGLSGEISAVVTVLGPSWTAADTVVLYANGTRVREQSIEPSRGKILKARVTWKLPLPRHDIYLVGIATGPGITEPFWPIARPYQPTSPVWEPRILGSTNPVWIDSDGDRVFTSARSYAARAVESARGDASRLLQILGRFDEAVAAQAAGLWHDEGKDTRSPELKRLLQKAGLAVQRGFKSFANTLNPAVGPR